MSDLSDTSDLSDAQRELIKHEQEKSKINHPQQATLNEKGKGTR